jgi:hypothetical protein
MIGMMVLSYVVNVTLDIVAKGLLVYVVAFSAHRGWQAGKRGK